MFFSHVEKMLLMWPIMIMEGEKKEVEGMKPLIFYS